MKKTKLSIFLLAIVLGIGMFFGGAGDAEAKSTLWQQLVAGSYGGGQTYGGVSNPTFTITYEARVRNKDNGAILNDGAVVPIGTNLAFEFLPNGFSWVGTGYFSDSPFGIWSNANLNQIISSTRVEELGAALGLPVSCFPSGGYTFCNMDGGYGNSELRSGFFEGSNGDGNGATFVAKVPTTSVSQIGTAGVLSCDAQGVNCSVISAGTIIPRFNYASTPIYYFDNLTFDGGFNNSQILTNVGSSLVGIPAQNISFNLTAFNPNNPPTTPTLTCPANGVINTNYDFTATSTDPENNTLYYNYDWPLGAVVDERVPAIGYVASGTSQTASHSWATTGAKTVSAQSCDSLGNCSGWGSCTTNITAPPPPPPAPTLIFTGAPNPITTGSSTTLTWTTTNTQSCWASSGWTGWKTATGGTSPVSPVSTTTYSLECWNPSGVSTGIKSVTINVDNGCAANTCMVTDNGSATTCDNGINPNTPGVEVESFTDTCVFEDRACTAAECGQTIPAKTFNFCSRIDSSGCMNSTTCLPSTTCSDSTTQDCPPCPLGISGWQEVAP